MEASSKVDALLYALTGQRAAASSDDIEVRLSRIGWSPEKVADFARDCMAAGRPWPVPVNSGEIAVSHSVLTAQLWEFRERFGLCGQTLIAAPGRPLSADDRRLMEQRPPHWG